MENITYVVANSVFERPMYANWRQVRNWM